MKLRALLLAITLLVLVGQGALYHPISAATGPVKRVFYFSTGAGTYPRTLSFSTPEGTTSSQAEFGAAPTDFVLPDPLFNSITVTGQVVFGLWLFANRTEKIPIRFTLEAGAGPLPTPQVLETVDLIPRSHNFTYDVSGFPLLSLARVSVSVIATPPNGTAVTLLWGSTFTPSFVALPLSGYASVDNVVIRDSFTRPTTNFDLNATVGNNVVSIEATATSAFGADDIPILNLTIVDPRFRSARIGSNGETSIRMQPSPFNRQFPPFDYFFRWPYPPNSTEGVYQISIDVIDSQNHTAFSYQGATFVLSRGLFLSPSLIPYFAAGGIGVAGIAGAFVYYRRRKSKSYLAPFGYFNNLTGGEISGGTFVTIEGNTGSGKTILSEQLMFEDLKNGRPCVFVATGDFPSNVRFAMKGLGLDVTGYEQSGLLTFVDGYSYEAGQESREKFSIPSLADLTTIGVKITSSLPSGSFKGGSLYFDSLTPLVSRAKPESIVSLVQSVGARVKGMSGKAFFTVGPSVDSSVQRQLEELSDCVVQMEAFEERGVRKSRLRIAKYRARKYQQGWSLYTIEEGKGMIFYSKKPQK